MREVETDVVILGAGTAGLTARRSVEKSGKRAVLVDPGPFGTTCARVGCMPSKLLIAAGEAAEAARHAAVFGVDASVSIDGRRVFERVRRERDRFVASVREPVDGWLAEGVLIRGRGRFVGPTAIQVDDHTLVRAGAVVLATGSHPFVPPHFRGLGDLLLTSDTVFELKEIPKKLLVIGTGPVGLELGQALSRLACEVTIIGNDGRVGPFEDPKMQAEARLVMDGLLDLHHEITLESAERVDGGARIAWKNPDGSRHERVVDRVLVAAGRKVDWTDLGLEHAGIPLQGGVPVADPTTGQVGGSAVFVAGDATTYRPILHEAADEGHIAGQNAASFPKIEARPRRTALGIVFTEPQMAVVGTPWSELRCVDHRVGEIDWRTQGRSQVIARALGRTRIYGEVGSGRILGAEMLGPSAEHLAHLVAWAVQARLSVADALAMPFYHPVVEEGLRTALGALRDSLRESRPPGLPCEEFGPGG